VPFVSSLNIVSMILLLLISAKHVVYCPTGLLAFKSTSATRWYVNAPIPEIAAVRERFFSQFVILCRKPIPNIIYLLTRPSCIHSRSKHMSCRIQFDSGKHNDVEPTASSIAQIATFEPNDIMVHSSPIFRQQF
jgi:hypothetical protein